MDYSNKYLGLAAAGLLTLAVSGADVHATPLPGGSTLQTTTESGVSFEIAPFYAWIPGMTGSTTVFGATAQLDFTPFDVIANLGDLVDVLDGIYMGAGEVRYDKFGFMYDVFYMGVSSARAIDGNFVNGALDVGFDLTFATLAASYRLFETPQGHLDAMAGARIWDVTTKVGLNLNVAGLNASDGDTWVDPLIGVKGRMDVSENVYVSGWGLVGGVVTGSDFMWDAWGNVGYRYNDTFDFFAGLRATGTDYKSGGFAWDVVQWGPIIGATIKLN